MRPQTIGPYTLEARLGAGGMGEVYQAYDQRLDRRVAIKLIRPEKVENATARERFRREARAAARLSHPAIVQIYDIVESDESDAIVLELVEGEPLSSRIARGPLPVEEAVRLGRQIAEGLAAAHAKGLIHRDLKPENVMITTDGWAKILDFGLAKRLEGEVSLTADQRVMGTFRAMSPEQARGLPVDHRSDLFSLGILLYEMLAGKSPFDGGSTLETLTRICSHRQTPLWEVDAGIPQRLSDLVDRLLAKDPYLRPQSTRELDATLRDLESPPAPLGDPGHATWIDPLAADRSFLPAGISPAEDPSKPRSRWLRSSRRLLLAAALALLAAGLVYAFRQRSARVPLFVAVARPEIVTQDDGRASLVALGLRGALLRSLLSLDGVLPVALEQVDLASGPPAAIARATQADEVVTSRLECANGTCQVSLYRIRGKNGGVLWFDSFAVPLEQPYLCNEIVETGLRRGYKDLKERPGTKGLEVRPKDYQEYLRLQYELNARKSGVPLDGLLDRLASIQRSSPRFVDAYILEAELLRQRFGRSQQAEDIDRALEAIAKARELAPTDPRPLFSLAEVAFRGQRLDLAESAIADLEKIQPGEPGILVQRARLLERRGAGKQAVALMREAVRRHSSIYNLSRLADMEYRLGESLEARRHLHELLARFPDYYSGWSLLAQIELEYGNPQRAAEIYSTLIRRSLQVDEMINLGTAFMLMARYSQAEELFRQVLGLEPGNPSALLSLSDTLLLQGRKTEAEKLYRDLVRLIDSRPSPGSWSLVSMKAQALAHLGERQQAVEAAQKVLLLAPESPQAAQEVSLTYVLVGDLASALVNARRALQQGVDPVWFSFPWFDPLRSSADLRPLLEGRKGSPG